ncbi:MAG TPA: hypothetical protein PL009_08620 [Flavipsychrobacter sp.]|nr:hypothetical protein [Flavipsychrobacter sp.]
MAEQETLSVAIINRIYPPGKGITGESAAELAKFFLSKDIKVNIVHVEAEYNGGHANATSYGSVHKVRTFYNGKGKLIRLFSSLYEGYKLIQKGKKLRADVIICMTDPPLLNFWAALLLPKNTKWMLWSMDIYPEAFIAGKLINANNFFYRLVDKEIKKNPPSHIIALGKYQAAMLHKKYGSSIGITILPCGIYDKNDNENIATELPSWKKDDKIIIGYCGNLGEAHSTEFLASVIDNIDPNLFTVVLALYGSHASQMLKYAKGKEGVVIIDNVKRKELKYIDIHLASLSENWVNVSVPSKTVSSVCAGSSFLYHGVKTSDNWEILNNAGWIIEGNQIDEQVKSFFSLINKEEIKQKKLNASEVGTQLNTLKKEAFEEIYLQVKSLSRSSKS